MNTPETFRCFLVRKTGRTHIEAGLQTRPFHELPPGDVLIRVARSSLNFKDALAVEGHPGVVKAFPHVPGIDAAGTLVEGAAPDVQPGDEVIVTGFELGAGRWGGWAEFVRVPAEWVVPRPAGLSADEAMTFGTAGFTAGLSVRALRQQGVSPDDGEVLVTGATGGVGSLAVAILAKLGYTVVAVSGKTERHAWLQDLGAARVVGREELHDDSGRPLLSARWAGAVDTVGGSMLATILRSTRLGGCVTACGLVGGTDLPLTVHPFILRGITLAGIDSAWCPRARRLEVWRMLADEWKPPSLPRIAETIDLAEVEPAVQAVRFGHHVGRTVIRVS